MKSVVDSFYPEPGKLAAIIVEINSDIGDLCHGWACATPGDQFIDRDICTFNNDLNLPGLAVPDPPCQSQIVRLLFCRTSIPDALNVARDKQVGTIFLRFVVRRSHSKEVYSGHMVYTGTDKLTSSDKCNLANFHQATAAFHSLNALILRFL